MIKDLNCFIQFLSQFNGKVMFLFSRSRINIFVDACLTSMGALWDDNIYAISRHHAATVGLNITQLEALNVLVAVRVSAEQRRCQTVRVHGSGDRSIW